jgi:hypothetical protein
MSRAEKEGGVLGKDDISGVLKSSVHPIGTKFDSGFLQL